MRVGFVEINRIMYSPMPSHVVVIGIFAMLFEMFIEKLITVFETPRVF